MAGTHPFFSPHVPNTANPLNMAFSYSLSFKSWSNITIQKSELARMTPSRTSLLNTRPDAACCNRANACCWASVNRYFGRPDISAVLQIYLNICVNTLAYFRIVFVFCLP